MSFFKRRPSKVVEPPPRVRPRPSLPELKSPTDVQWPANLVDKETMESIPDTNAHAAKSSLKGSDQQAIPFHKPFRGVSDTGLHTNGATISSLYMADPVDISKENWRSKATPVAVRHRTQRRAKLAPTFNLMVVGGQGTGKTNMLRLLLETADISPTATADQRAALERFLHGGNKATANIETVCVEITESKFDRVLFSVVDTPGLDFVEGRELKLERQVSGIIRYIDAQYADTMSEESKVIRKSKGDQHIHLCVYLIDPSSVISAAARRSLSSLPGRSKSQTTVSASNPPDLVPDTASLASEDDTEAPLTMSPAELRVLKRLAGRVNVLPIIARADSLTDEQLALVKQAIRDDLHTAGIGFGIFGDPPNTVKNENLATPRKTHFVEPANGHLNGDASTEADEEEEEERQSRPIIKLRGSRRGKAGLSRSRSRRDLSRAAQDDSVALPIDDDTESVANVRFSAHIIAKVDISSLLPFAIITPENIGRIRRAPSPSVIASPSSPDPDSEDGQHSTKSTIEPMTPASPQSAHLGYLDGPPADLKGVFVRRFRWGTIDVLNPDHCDFSALRTSILSTHIKVLKTSTKEVLYEKYRTEKLLARRATSQITEEERQRLLEDLGL
ncbi:septin family protein [Flagelloscypha sp. PMI_526]|nr:septin family protein [Flagelloscypha sp. PMI_526]